MSMLIGATGKVAGASPIAVSFTSTWGACPTWLAASRPLPVMRHNVAPPARRAPLMLRSNFCSESVAFTTASVRYLRSALSAATMSRGYVGLPALVRGRSPTMKINFTESRKLNHLETRVHQSHRGNVGCSDILEYTVNNLARNFVQRHPPLLRGSPSSNVREWGQNSTNCSCSAIYGMTSAIPFPVVADSEMRVYSDTKLF